MESDRDTPETGDQVFVPRGDAPVLRHRRADQVAEEIKRWTVFEGLSPGHRLPKEPELANWFGCGRGTVREALKALEVQGFVTIKTGPKGGAVLREPDYARTADQLKAFLNYQELTIANLYDMRLIVEPAMARAVVAVVDDELIADLEASNTPRDSEARSGDLGVRKRELDFHTILANKCPNPLLGFQSRFISAVLSDLIQFENPEAEIFARFTEDNVRFHADLIDAYRNNDADAVEAHMHAHMVSAYQHTMSLEGVMPFSLLVSPTGKKM